MRSDKNYHNYIKDYNSKSVKEKLKIIEDEDLDLAPLSKSDYSLYKPLLDLYLFYIKTNYFQQMESLNHLSDLCDLTVPHNSFPATRMKKRVIYYHMGPTNSGKTFAALQHLKKAKTGVYLSPLRLLACEVADKLNKENIKCSMETGQEKEVIENATHFSCTIEIAPFNSHYECAVIDEVQMISDEYRGDQWTNAILGIRADEVHLCGEGRALKLVANLCQLTGETLIKKEYTRLSHLNLEPGRIHSISQLKAGDCIIAFSKKKIFKIKNMINQFLGKNKNHCAVIYGSLPPEVKKIQAKMFNNNEEDIKFLIATDAIGMGLNLNIKRIIFFETSKTVRNQVSRKLTEFECRQIAGRAGRSSETGFVTAINEVDLFYIRKCFTGVIHQKQERYISEQVVFDSDKYFGNDKDEKEYINNRDGESESDSDEKVLDKTNNDKKDDFFNKEEDSDSESDEKPNDTSKDEYEFSEDESRIERGCIFPSQHVIQEFAEAYSKLRKMENQTNDYISLSDVLIQLENLAKCSDFYFFRKIDDMLDIHQEIKDIKADIRTQYYFCKSPTKSKSVNMYLKFFLMQLTEKKEVRLPEDFHLENKTFNKNFYEPDHLQFYEEIYNVLECYIWLSKHFTCQFVEVELAKVMKERLNNIIDSILQNMDYDFGKDLKTEEGRSNNNTSENNSEKNNKTKLFQKINNLNNI